MSFRARLFLFFVIIVVVPMIAVALVLFSLTSDSETGKADAQIAQGLRVGFSQYDEARARARVALGRVVRDPALGRALTAGEANAVRTRIDVLVAREHIVGIFVYDTRGKLSAAAGDR